MVEINTETLSVDRLLLSNLRKKLSGILAFDTPEALLKQRFAQVQ